MSNKNLNDAKKAKKDEFYTTYSDVYNEVIHYKKHFEDKVIFCNCNDSEESAFWKVFLCHFEEFKLKKLIATYFIDEQGYKLEYDGKEVRKEEIEGEGDFRSDASLELLKQSDIVVTNPPFSLFREYVATLMKYNKQFLIIGNINAITYKEIFPLIKENRLWLGVSIHSGDRKFYVPDNYPLKASGCGIDNNGKKYICVKGVRWFTNIDHTKRHRPLEMGYVYNGYEYMYPKYDNYDAINVDKICQMPCDYNGVMGVPITFIDKYDPEQFEIIGMLHPYINSKALYKRILIQKK